MTMFRGSDRINESELRECFLCPECNNASFSEEWDNATLLFYSNRQQRRAHITFLKGLKRSNITYICPCCSKQVLVQKIERI